MANPLKYHPKSVQKCVKMSPDFQNKVDAFLATYEGTFSELVRRLLLEHILQAEDAFPNLYGQAEGPEELQRAS